MLDHLQQARITAEEIFADIGTGLDGIFLVLAVDDLPHPFGQNAFGIFFQQGVPIFAPDDFNDVPLGAAEDRFELLDDLAVTAHGTIEALKIAVDDEDKVIEMFARGQMNSAQ